MVRQDPGRSAMPAVAASGVSLLPTPKVLVADDDRYLAALVRQTLEECEITVEVASNGEEALRIANWFQPDAIVLDTMMPVIDGIEVLERLRRNVLHQVTPVLMLTSLRTVSDIQRAMASGASGYLTKPFRPDELLKRVQWMLDPPTSAARAPSGDGLVLDA